MTMQRSAVRSKAAKNPRPPRIQSVADQVWMVFGIPQPILLAKLTCGHFLWGHSTPANAQTFLMGRVLLCNTCVGGRDV